MQERGKQTILSLGLDIGTTTTILVISELTVKNVASATSVPRVEIVDKRVRYLGSVHFTPLLDESTLDEEALTRLVLEEYSKAGVRPEQIESGAVIVTGQSALKSNAERVLRRLSANLGKFVVATAGPRLEAIIAGRGSGAAARSLEKKRTVANLDVGGGTTNIAVFDNGKPRDALALNVGGRLIRVNPHTHRVEHISHPGQLVLRSLGFSLKVGDRLSLEAATAICRRLAEVIEEVMRGALSQLAVSLVIGEPRGPRLGWRELSFSGGVGKLVYEAEGVSNPGEAFRFGDIGPVLAQEITRTRLWASGDVFRPDQTIYATVIGAGSYMTELSGSTIFISNPEVLPLRDIPVVKPADHGLSMDEAMIREAVLHGLELVDIDPEGEPHPVALVLDVGNPRFEEIKRLSAGIARAFGSEWKAPIVIVARGDFGKVLGQTLVNDTGALVPIVCIDQVDVSDGDYIDIGEPMYSGTVVPVIVKTLVFSQ